MSSEASDLGRLIVVSFDPGVTTGWAWHCASQKSLSTKGTAETLREMRPDVELHTLDPCVQDLELGYDFGQIVGDENDIVDEMLGLVREAWSHWRFDEGSGDVLMIVTEDFVLREMNSSRALLAPVRINAMFGRELRSRGLGLIRQSPSDAKSVCTNERLRSWNVYSSSSGEHARDAQRHGILGMRKWAGTPALRAMVGSGMPRTTSALVQKGI